MGFTVASGEGHRGTLGHPRSEQGRLMGSHGLPRGEGWLTLGDQQQQKRPWMCACMLVGCCLTGLSRGVMQCDDWTGMLHQAAA